MSPPRRYGKARQARQQRADGGPEPAEHETRNAYTGGTVLSLPVKYRRVKQAPLNGEAARVMAALVLDELLRFTPATRSEAALWGVALRHAKALYEGAKRLAREVAILNSLVAERGEGAST